MITAGIERVLIKISGESLSGGNDGIFDFNVINRICRDVKQVLDQGIKVSIVIGAGNIARGRELKNFIGGDNQQGVADNIGMLATSINALLLEEMFRSILVDTVVLSPLPMPFGIKNFNLRNINENKDNKLIIFACGLGFPYFSTDTVAVIGSLMTNSDILLKATKTDGIYDEDPELNPNAVHLPRLSYQEAVGKKVMDQTAFTIAMENKLPIMVFSINEDNCFVKALSGNIKYSVVYDG